MHTARERRRPEVRACARGRAHGPGARACARPGSDGVCTARERGRAHGPPAGAMAFARPTGKRDFAGPCSLTCQVAETYKPQHGLGMPSCCLKLQSTPPLTECRRRRSGRPGFRVTGSESRTAVSDSDRPCAGGRRGGRPGTRTRFPSPGPSPGGPPARAGLPVQLAVRVRVQLVTQ